MATHSSILAWRIPWTEAPSRLQSMVSQESDTTQPLNHIVVVVQSLNRVRLYATPCTAARQPSLSFTVSGSLLKFMSVESVMPSNHLFPLCLRLLDTQMFPLDIYPGLPLAFREFLYHDPYFILKSKKYIMLYSDAKSLQSCPTLCDPIDGNPPGSPVPGILQVRTLEWVAISFSNA